MQNNRDGLFANANQRYIDFCEGLTPGKTMKHDFTKSMDFGEDNEVNVPKIAVFSPEFYRAIYNYYAKQLSQPALEEGVERHIKNNAELEVRIGKLMESADKAPYLQNKGLDGMGDLRGHNLIIGEITHSSVSPKKFLIQNMQALKDAGCDTLYMEHIPYDQMQHSLDQFNEGKVDVLDEKVAAKFREFDRGYGLFPSYDDKQNVELHRKLFAKEWKKIISPLWLRRLIRREFESLRSILKIFTVHKTRIR